MSAQDRLEADHKAIEELHRTDIAATKAYDVETLVSLWTDDIVALSPGQAPSVGKQKGRSGLEKGRAQMANIEVIRYDQEWKEVQVSGDYAYEWGVFHSAFRPRGGDVIRQTHNVMRVLKRGAGGQWRVHRTIWNEAPTPAE
ncbi:MAG TPA: DUF4440 domain-containing protein [Candidatus Acidoferrales bacterium]